MDREVDDGEDEAVTLRGDIFLACVIRQLSRGT